MESSQSPRSGIDPNSDAAREAGLALALADFEYLSQTAFQVNEDRARVSQFFLATFGTLIAAIYSRQPDGEKLLLSTREINLIFSLLFLVITVYGFVTLAQLVRLRTSWMESVMAMNALKARAAERFAGIGQPADLFPWTNAGSRPDAGPYDGLPPYFNANSVGQGLAFSVAGLTGIAAAAATAFLGLAGGDASLVWWRAAGAGLAAFSVSRALYRSWLLAAERERDARLLLDPVATPPVTQSPTLPQQD